MSVPFILLLVGILTVVGGIIRFKLHAFLALTLAALVVGLLRQRNYWLSIFIRKKVKPLSRQTNWLKEHRYTPGRRIWENKHQDWYSYCHGRHYWNLSDGKRRCLRIVVIPFLLGEKRAPKPSREVVFFWGYRYFLTLFFI